MRSDCTNTIRMWNPKVSPNVFLDFGEIKIVSLESMHPNIEVYLSDFHLELLLHRYINKVVVKTA